jgi:hypothetical protein
MKMKQVNYSLLFVFSTAMFLSLIAFKNDKNPCIKGEGTAVTENREISGVSSISLQSSANLNITQGESYTCSISGQRNILDNLKFKHDGNKLTIFEEECVDGHAEVIINITLPVLNMVRLEGSGNIQVAGAFDIPSFEAGLSGSGNINIKDALVATNLVTKISGSGNINMNGSFKKAETGISGSGNISISGKCAGNNIHITGSGKLHAFDFSTQTTNVHTSGSGNLEINASHALDINILGSGNIWYKGDPEITKKITGSGRVNKK